MLSWEGGEGEGDGLTSAVLGTASQKTSILSSPCEVCSVTDISTQLLGRERATVGLRLGARGGRPGFEVEARFGRLQRSKADRAGGRAGGGRGLVRMSTAEVRASPATQHHTRLARLKAHQPTSALPPSAKPRPRLSPSRPVSQLEPSAALLSSEFDRPGSAKQPCQST